MIETIKCLASKFWETLPSGASATFLYGLIAMVLGALFNAHLNRKRDDRLRKNEMRATAAALYSEILVMREIVADMGQAIGRRCLEHGDFNLQKNDEVVLFRLSEPVVFEALAPKLNLLGPDWVRPITEFYLHYASLKTCLRFVSQAEGKQLLGSSMVLVPARMAVVDVIPTLRSIEVSLEIEKQAPEPEIGLIIKAIAQEKLIYPD